VHLYRCGLFHYSLIPVRKARYANTVTVAAVCDRRSNIFDRPLKSDVPERLRRLDYTFQRLPIYFVMACTHKRQRILNNAAVQARLIEFSQVGNDRGGMLGAYVLMPDHFHAFVIIDDARLSLSSWMKSLKNSIIENTSSVKSSIASLAKRIF
jgi:Transposase IS200 like